MHRTLRTNKAEQEKEKVKRIEKESNKKPKKRRKTGHIGKEVAEPGALAVLQSRRPCGTLSINRRLERHSLWRLE